VSRVPGQSGPDRYDRSALSHLAERWTEEQGRAAVAERCWGRCEGCGLPNWQGQVHHRVFRSHCGPRLLWHPSNLLALCGSGTTGCHGRAHHERTTHEGLGWNLPGHLDPLLNPAWIRDPYNPVVARWALLHIEFDTEGTRRAMVKEVLPQWIA
jgi:hypothetical protein